MNPPCEKMANPGFHVARLLLAFVAISLDANSLDAKLFLSRCTAHPWLAAISPAAWMDHLVAFPYSQAAMLITCTSGLARLGKHRLRAYLGSVALMTLAMLPACALAMLTSGLGTPGSATWTYGATMFAVMILLVEVLPRCIERICVVMRRGKRF